jgi:hypothetical protein
MRITPSSAFYIKLGHGGEHEQECIKINQTLWLGYREVPHELCLRGEWEEAKAVFMQKEVSDPGAVTRHINQIRTFYEADQDVLWVTFYDNRLWWCFARSGVSLLPDRSKVRHAIDGWKSEDIHGQPLDMGRLSGKLLSMQGFRGTICSVREIEYLVRKINGEQSPVEQTALNARDALVHALEEIIKSLDWKEFELLTDLIFRQAGWQRISQLGKTQKTLDLDLFSPIAGERYLVQVKSRADRRGFEEFQETTQGMEEDYTRFYFVVHTPASDLTAALETDTYRLWLPAQIASLAVQYGLVDWVIEKAT